LNVSVTRTTFGAGLTPRGPLGQDSAPQLDTLVDNRITEYTDVGSRATLGLGRHELGFLVIQRLGGPAIRRTAWELSGVWWVSAGVGVVGATGHSLPQFGLTVPAARYGTLGLRLALGAQPRHREKARRERDVRAAMTPRVVLAPAGRLSFVGVNGTIGEVMGDFTDWEPRRLVRSGEGRWTVPLVLSPGVHHLNVRFDGGGWLVPEGAVAVDDGFGGGVGLIVVR
jgi:hypothetical protein